MTRMVDVLRDFFDTLRLRGTFPRCGGALPIKIGDDPVGAAGVSGAPGGEKDEACVQTGLDKVADRLK